MKHRTAATSPRRVGRTQWVQLASLCLFTGVVGSGVGLVQRGRHSEPTVAIAQSIPSSGESVEANDIVENLSDPSDPSDLSDLSDPSGAGDVGGASTSSVAASQSVRPMALAPSDRPMTAIVRAPQALPVIVTPLVGLLPTPVAAGIVSG